METRGPQSDVLIHDLQETLVRLIYDRWPGSKQDEDPPFTFTVPCPTAGCKGKYALTVLQAEQREGHRVEAFCDARRPHRHQIATLLYGIELPSAVAEIRRSALAGQTFGQPPRLLEISEPTEINAGKQFTKDRVGIQLYCELSEKLVTGAGATIEVPKDWADELRKWVPWAAGHLKTLWSTHEPDFDFEGLPQHEDRKSDGKHVLGLPKGRLMRPEEQILPRALGMGQQGRGGPQRSNRGGPGNSDRTISGASA